MLRLINRPLARAALAAALVVGAATPLGHVGAAEAAAFQPDGPVQRPLLRLPAPVPGVVGVAQLRSVPAEVASAARAAAAGTLGVPVPEVTLDTSGAVRWSDTSLGCRQPDRVYAQVITPGFRVAASARGGRVEVHADATGRRAFVCRNPTR